jgi:hypothetical protein
MKLFLFLTFITLLISLVIGNAIIIDDSESVASVKNSTVSKSTKVDDDELAASVVNNSTKIEDKELADSEVKNEDNELADSEVKNEDNEVADSEVKIEDNELADSEVKIEDNELADSEVNNSTKIEEDELIKKTFNYTDISDLDVYYNKAYIHNKRPVVMHVHGGGWCEGSKDNEAYMGEFFQKNGYVAVLINYRLYPQTENLDDMVEDIYNALQWTIENIHQYGGDAHNISLMGHSAGAHLATLTTVKAALEMEVNGVQLEPIHLSNLVSLNGRHKLDEGDELLAGIEQLKQLGNIPGLSFLKLYGEAREHLLVGKSGFDQSKILKEYEDKSLKTLGADKYTFVECDADTVDPLGLAEPMIEQLKRTVKRVEIDHLIYEGDHQFILNGIMNGDEKVEHDVLNMVN